MTRRAFLGRLEAYTTKLWLGRIDAPLSLDDLAQAKSELDRVFARAAEDLARSGRKGG
jgi:hypothetical protein